MEQEEKKPKGGKRGPGARGGAGNPRAAARKAARAAVAAGATGEAVEKRGRRKAVLAAGAAVAAGAAIAGRGGKGRGKRGGGKALAKLVGGLRKRRMFDGGELRLVLLKLIADEPRHGYELIKSVEDLTSGAYAPSPGVVYPTLTMLNETGHVSGEDVGDGRKRFTITEAGRAELADNDGPIAKLLGRLSNVGEKHKRTDAMPVRRAMGNLKTALQHRLGQGETTDDTLLQVAALIDEVAQKIERLD